MDWYPADTHTRVAFITQYPEEVLIKLIFYERT